MVNTMSIMPLCNKLAVFLQYISNYVPVVVFMLIGLVYWKRLSLMLIFLELIFPWIWMCVWKQYVLQPVSWSVRIYLVFIYKWRVKLFSYRKMSYIYHVLFFQTSCTLRKLTIVKEIVLECSTVRPSHRVNYFRNLSYGIIFE